MDNQIHCEKCHFVVFREVNHRGQTWFRRKDFLLTKCGQCDAALKLPCGVVRFQCVPNFDKWHPEYTAYWLD